MTITTSFPFMRSVLGCTFPEKSVVFTRQLYQILILISHEKTSEVSKRVEVKVFGCSIYESWATDPLWLHPTLEVSGSIVLLGKIPYFTF